LENMKFILKKLQIRYSKKIKIKMVTKTVGDHYYKFSVIYRDNLNALYSVLIREQKQKKNSFWWINFFKQYKIYNYMLLNLKYEKSSKNNVIYKIKQYKCLYLNYSYTSNLSIVY